MILTGEGQTDYQTAFGKVPVGIAVAAAMENVPVICISGSLGIGFEDVYDKGIKAIFSIAPGPLTLEKSIMDAEKNIIDTTCNIIKTYFNNLSVK